MSKARSTSEKGIRVLLKKKLGKTYNIDETYVDYVVGGGPRTSAPIALPDHEAGVVERVLLVDGLPARITSVRGGRLVLVPKIIPAT